MNLSVLGLYRDVWVARNPPGFAFVLFEDSRDAEDACREMDGRYVCGEKVRVERLKDRPEVEDLKGLEKSVMSAGESVTSLDSVEAEGNQAWVEIGIADQDDRAVGEF